jgi:hypothetical protein
LRDEANRRLAELVETEQDQAGVYRHHQYCEARDPCREPAVAAAEPVLLGGLLSRRWDQWLQPAVAIPFDRLSAFSDVKSVRAIPTAEALSRFSGMELLSAGAVLR